MEKEKSKHHLMVRAQQKAVTEAKLADKAKEVSDKAMAGGYADMLKAELEKAMLEKSKPKPKAEKKGLLDKVKDVVGAK